MKRKTKSTNFILSTIGRADIAPNIPTALSGAVSCNAQAAFSKKSDIYMIHLFEMLLVFPQKVSLYLILIVTFIIIFYFFKKIGTKYTQHNKTKNLIAFIAATLIISGYYITYLIAYSSYEESIAFNKSHWDTHRHDRFNMANDIIDTEMLIGKDTSQVKQILGIPDSRNPTIYAWYYNMGWGKGGLGFLNYNLAVKFDNGKASKVAQFTIRD